MFLRDKSESFGRTINRMGKRASGMSTFHWLTLGSIAASIALFASGRKQLALFIGLWPPTFQALKASMKD